MAHRMLERPLPVEASAEPVLAWRAWALTGRRDASELLLRPVAGRTRPWHPGRPAEAGCKVGWFHQAPHPECSCGLHGTHDLELLRQTRCPAVLGRVALWGRVIEHDLGFRARFGYPQRLRLICQFCFWQWGPNGSVPAWVGWFPKDDLVPMCDPHVDVAARYGMRAEALLLATEVEQRLRARYGVDPLAI